MSQQVGDGGSVRLPVKFVQRAEDPNEAARLQLDYAWKWFQFHADQRTKMFNYMLIVFGLFANAIAATIGKPGLIALTPWLCWFAAVLALVFALLDRRNRDLVWFGEDVLINLEREFVFGEGVKRTGRGREIFEFGILSRQEVDERKERRNAPQELLHDIWRGKHRRLLPGVALLMAAAFAVAGIWVYTNAECLGT